MFILSKFGENSKNNTKEISLKIPNAELLFLNSALHSIVRNMHTKFRVFLIKDYKIIVPIRKPAMRARCMIARSYIETYH